MKTALIFGSSGLIGSQILKLLINDDNYNKMRYIDYNLKDAITNFKNQYK